MRLSIRWERKYFDGSKAVEILQQQLVLARRRDKGHDSRLQSGICFQMDFWILKCSNWSDD